jgi:hypothetical protein
LRKTFLGVLVILATALVLSSILVIKEASALAGWQLALGILYPLQVALDLVGVARFSWGFLKWLCDFEMELSADRLRTGLRLGPLWLDSQTIPVAQIKRLVVGKRPEDKSIIWELAAEHTDGSRLILLSADDPVNVIPLAKDLHTRLARREEHCDRWPALAEEDRPAEVETDRPLPRSLLPGGAWTWLAIHVAGAFGLWPIGRLPWFQAHRVLGHISVFWMLAILQGLILFGNIAIVLVKLKGGDTSAQPEELGPHILQTGSREVVVEKDPFEEKPTFKTLMLHRADQQLLVLKNAPGARLIPLLPFLVGVLFIYVSIAKAEWWALFGAAMFLLVALFLWGEMLLRVELDASTRQMRTIWLWKQWERPLEQLLAVQLTKCELSPRYYLTLILDDEKERRRNLAWFGKWEPAQDAGKELAAFLGIPLLDDVPDRPGK